jgi:hypothetical protein
MIMVCDAMPPLTNSDETGGREGPVVAGCDLAGRDQRQDGGVRLCLLVG